MTEVLTPPITNDSFLDLLDELRDELEMISTTNAMNPNAKVDDDIENAVTKCNEIVDVIAADLVAKHDHVLSGYTHINKCLPTNTLNNTALYVGINTCGFVAVFNKIDVSKVDGKTVNNCYYIFGKHEELVMTDLAFWKILERPTTSDFFNQGEQAFHEGMPCDNNPYPTNTNENYHWNLGWHSSGEYPF